MRWLLDTNIWISLLKQPGGTLEQHVLNQTPAQIVLCSVVKSELWHGAFKYGRTEQRQAVLKRLFQDFLSIPFDDEAARHYAEIRHELESSGRIIGPYDLQIAAICQANQLTLVTANIAEFSRVSGLVIENWLD